NRARTSGWSTNALYDVPHELRPARAARRRRRAARAGLGCRPRDARPRRDAVDAMVAVNATLGVVYPHMTGAGGDAFWLVHDADAGAQHVLRASGRAASAATRALSRRRHRIPRRGGSADGPGRRRRLGAGARRATRRRSRCFRTGSRQPAIPARTEPRWGSSGSAPATVGPGGRLLDLVLDRPCCGYQAVNAGRGRPRRTTVARRPTRRADL
ncbi:MAG: oxamate amidohydrolase, partial [Solirubrobacteraceae bacterium]|nr:oxamate amidohydrolase [Solirubrobacteraceae bacterium]